MPMVDDPFDFGRIAATNAISDVYAMGGKPIMALAILGMPVDKIPTEMVREILKGGASVCASAGIPVAGGHSIDCPEPVYGLAVIGTCRPEHVRRNADARAGDALILTKPIGVGIYSAAIKKGELSPAGYTEMIATTTLLNRIGAELAHDKDVHAITDVTGFGLLGHALEMARGSNLALTIAPSDVPLLTQAAALAQRGLRHRRLASQLGELLRRRRAAGWLPGLAAPPADRSTDLRWPADCLRAGACRRDRALDQGGGISHRTGHWPCQAGCSRSGGRLRRGRRDLWRADLPPPEAWTIGAIAHQSGPERQRERSRRRHRVGSQSLIPRQKISQGSNPVPKHS